MKNEAFKIIVFGASGKTGQHLVQYGIEDGYEVSAYVRNTEKLKAVVGKSIYSKIHVFEGDALNKESVGKAMRGHNAAINVAAHRDDAQVFESICNNIVNGAQNNLIGQKRLWLFGGLPGLNIPHTKTIGSDLVGMRPILKSHKVNLELLKKSKDLDWSFMCPGPMFFKDDSHEDKKLKITTEEMPYKIGKWSRFLPKQFHPLIMLSQMNDLTISHQDVAKFVIENLHKNDPYHKKRVGIAYL